MKMNDSRQKIPHNIQTYFIISRSIEGRNLSVYLNLEQNFLETSFVLQLRFHL